MIRFKLIWLMRLAIYCTFFIYTQSFAQFEQNFELQFTTGANAGYFFDERPIQLSNAPLHGPSTSFTQYLFEYSIFLSQSVGINILNKQKKIGAGLYYKRYLNSRIPNVGIQPPSKYVYEDHEHFTFRLMYIYNISSWLRLCSSLGINYRIASTGITFDNSLQSYHVVDYFLLSHDAGISPGIKFEILLPNNFTFGIGNYYFYYFTREIEENNPPHTYILNATLGYRIKFNMNSIKKNE